MCETSLVTHHALRIRAVNRLNSQRTKFNAETRLILLVAREKLAEITRKSRRCSCHNTSFNCKMTQILASAEKPQRHEGFSRTTMRFSNYTIQTPRVLEYLSSKPLGSCQRNLNNYVIFMSLHWLFSGHATIYTSEKVCYDSNQSYPKI